MKDKDVVISRLTAEVERLSGLVEYLAGENRHLRESLSVLQTQEQARQEAFGRLQAENQSLREQIDRLKRNSSNSSKPPSSDLVKPPKEPKGKSNGNRGGQPGHAKHERTPFPPERIDRTVEYELPKEAAKGLRRLRDWHIVQQVDWAKRPLEIVEHRAARYLDPRTGRIVIAPLPAEVAKGGLVGPKLSALVAYLKARCHMSYATIQALLGEAFDLVLSEGELAKVVQKASAALQAPYEEVRHTLGKQGHLGIDETGHPENGKNLWTWCFRAQDFTVFHVDPSRGSQVLKEVLGETFGGIIGCDYFSAYRAYLAESQAWAQFCMAHLIREVRFLAEHTNRWVSRWGQKLLAWLRKLFSTLHRREKLTAAGFARSMDRIRRGFLQTARRPPPHSETSALAKRFRDRRTAEAYFTFLTTPGVEPTNNLTEQALRHVVIDRRITQGTRGERGRRWCERAWTVLATCAQQGRSAFQFIHHAILAHFNRQPAPSLLIVNP
jgi:transposase